MRYMLVFLAIAGMMVSYLALRVHYSTETAPCDINEKWDCGIVNHSPFAMIWGIPVAAIGIAGYVLMAGLAFRRAYGLLLLMTLGGLAFSLYLANIEAHILGVWCVYCVASLTVISLMTLLVLGTVIAQWRSPKPSV